MIQSLSFLDDALGYFPVHSPFTVMTKTMIFVFFCFSLTKAIQSQRNEIVEDFISKSNRDIFIINVDEDFDVRNLERPLTKFKIPSESFIGCEKIAKFDKFNVTSEASFDKFRVSRAFTDFIDIQSKQSCDYVIFSSSIFLESVLKCLVNSPSTFLISLSDDEQQFTRRDLTNLLNKTWTESGALRVYVSIAEQIYSFDPFHRTPEGIYGKLNLDSDFPTTEGLNNLNGYSLNVEMFDGTFTYSSVKEPKGVDDFIGPDANFARFIADKLNATSE